MGVDVDAVKDGRPEPPILVEIFGVVQFNLLDVIHRFFEFSY